MRIFFAYLLGIAFCAPVAAESFTAWVNESWKGNVTGTWAVLVVTDAGLHGVDAAPTVADLGVGRGANVTGTINTTAIPNRWATAIWYDTAAPDFEAIRRDYWVNASGVAEDIAVLPTQDAIWKAVQANYVDPGSTGYNQSRITVVEADTTQLKTDVAAVKGDTTQIITDVAAVKDETALIKADTTQIRTETGNLQSLLSGVNVTSIEGNDNVREELNKIWDALKTAHVGVDTFGRILQDIGAGQDPASFAQAVWEHDLSAYVSANQAGTILVQWLAGKRLDALLTAVKADTDQTIADVAAVKAETALIKTDTTGILADTAQLKTDVAAVKADTGPTKTDTTAILADTTTIKGDTAALRTGVNVTTIEGGDATTQMDRHGGWEALLAAHTTPNTFGAYVQSIATGTPGEIAAAVWATLRADQNAAGSMGEGMNFLVSLYNDWLVGGRLELLLQQAAATGSGTQPVILTDVDQEPVGAGRTVVLVKTSGGLAAEFPDTITIGIQNTWAIDFRNDMSVNDRIVEVADPIVREGPSGGITFPEKGRDKSLAKLRVASSAAGTYVVDVTVTYSTGSQARGRVTFTAVQ